MALKFNPEYVKLSYYSCFQSKEAFEDALNELLICTPEESKKHEKLSGLVREPQETVPVKNEKGEIVKNSKNGNGTVQGKRVESVVERAEIKKSIMSYLEAQQVDLEQMNETVFEFEISNKENGEEISTDVKNMALTHFLETIKDFLDYIVPIVSDDKGNFVDISNLIYSTQLNRLDRKMYVKVISINKLEISFLKQLWNVYVEFLSTDGKGGEKNELYE